MPAVYSLRADDEIDEALSSLGATPGNRSKIMKEAILHLAGVRRREQLASDPEAAMQLLVNVEKAVQRAFGVTG